MVAGWKRPGAPRSFLRRLPGSGGRSPRPRGGRGPSGAAPSRAHPGRAAPAAPRPRSSEVACRGSARLLSSPPEGMAGFRGAGEPFPIFILPPHITKQRALGFCSPFAGGLGEGSPAACPGHGDGSGMPSPAHLPPSGLAALWCFGHFGRSQRAEQSPQLGCWDPSHLPSAPSAVAGWRL